MPKIVTSIVASVDGIVDADSDWQFPLLQRGTVRLGWRRLGASLHGAGGPTVL